MLYKVSCLSTEWLLYLLECSHPFQSTEKSDKGTSLNHMTFINGFPWRWQNADKLLYQTLSHCVKHWTWWFSASLQNNTPTFYTEWVPVYFLQKFKKASFIWISSSYKKKLLTQTFKSRKKCQLCWLFLTKTKLNVAVSRQIQL